MTTRYIQHVTLTTGHTRQSWRHEISPEAMTVARDLISRPESIVPVLVPETRLRWSAQARCAIGTLYTLDAPLVTFGVAEHSRCGARLWRMLHEHQIHTATSAEHCPPEPWCAARIEPGISLIEPDRLALADLERCLAWAYLESIT